MNPPIHILYVDDCPLDRELVQDALEKEHGGFEVVEATSRAEFEAVLAQDRSIIIMWSTSKRMRHMRGRDEDRRQAYSDRSLSASLSRPADKRRQRLNPDR